MRIVPGSHVEAGGLAIEYIVVSSARGPAGSPVRHGDREAAEREAVRLARLHSGDTFTVFMSIASATTLPPVVIARATREDDDEIPF